MEIVQRFKVPQDFTWLCHDEISRYGHYRMHPASGVDGMMFAHQTYCITPSCCNISWCNYSVCAALTRLDVLNWSWWFCLLYVHGCKLIRRLLQKLSKAILKSLTAFAAIFATDSKLWQNRQMDRILILLLESTRLKGKVSWERCLEAVLCYKSYKLSSAWLV